ncbi:response regulator [Paenibacillus eucommiae]|uniref:DNA-binding NarL/FixJ family response regulator n=1 Tax=Paenibacillus eucommiae TaxID=1355755 RepID=A0ABS4J6T3_9BACL|nr:response regulator transcription factor [Paenibacillus eucommiae]MBP1995543.1 DNA-binding NarL/FixJ family response regulator [Paenibacillus eucommiae]
MKMKITDSRLYRLMIADDQFLTREGLKTILDSEEDMDVVGMAKNGMEAYELAAALLPDLILMDIQMPVMDGIASIKSIKRDFPHIVILILTTFVDDSYIVEGLSSGASGYILKDMDGDRLISAIRDAAAGQFVLQGVIAEKLAARLARKEHEYEGSMGEMRLTDREDEVSRLVMKGLSNKEIAEDLQISEGTVRNYVSTIYSKLEVNNRAEAIVRLLRKQHP